MWQKLGVILTIILLTVLTVSVYLLSSLLGDMNDTNKLSNEKLDIVETELFQTKKNAETISVWALMQAKENQFLKQHILSIGPETDTTKSSELPKEIPSPTPIKKERL